MYFLLNRNTRMDCEYESLPVRNAISILKRDMEKALSGEGEENRIVLQLGAGLEPEMFILDAAEDIRITACDDLGFVYALLFISERFLSIQPFWFWMDQEIECREQVRIPYGRYTPEKPVIKYRGWFFNDEVLLMKWDINGDKELSWRMAFEALLRCGGNMAIPGTDKTARINKKLAAEMGLWITHHHAEPLGAEMFVRAYPDKKPNYSENPDLFYRLWEESVIEQKAHPVIWTLGFRGQGDAPFWSTDSSGVYNTPEKRGALISELIEKQRQLVLRHVKNPVFCTNLYGEIMELYNQGHIQIDERVIKIYADNGFGKMVTRRRDNHNVRVRALPEVPTAHCGIYYHVSFYDLQAANHITMLPNTVDFVDRELSEVVEKHAVDYWLINCSNVRPHVYYLDAVRKKWYGQAVSDAAHSKAFAELYYDDAAGVAECLEKYPEAMHAYGKNEDEHAGEQFYTENIRIIVHHLIRNNQDNAPELNWLTGKLPLAEQIAYFCGICERGEEAMRAYFTRCEKVSQSLSGMVKQKFDATIFLQAKIHWYCTKGVILFHEGYKQYATENYQDAFMAFGHSAELFDQADEAMEASAYGVWNGFYFNDCFADVKHTAYMVRKIMGIVREWGDNVRHDLWYREAVYPIEDRFVMTLLVNDNHMTDWELYLALATSRL